MKDATSMDIDWTLIVRIVAVAACLAGAVGLACVTLWREE